MDNKAPKQLKTSKFLVVSVVITALIFLLADVGSSYIYTSRFPEPKYLAEARNHASNGEYEQAVDLYKQAIESAPASASVYNELAWLYVDEMETNYDEAILLAKTAIDLTEHRDYPGRDLVLANYYDTLGWAFYKSGEYEGAISALATAVSINERKSYVDHLQAAQKALSDTEH